MPPVNPKKLQHSSGERLSMAQRLAARGFCLPQSCKLWSHSNLSVSSSGPGAPGGSTRAGADLDAGAGLDCDGSASEGGRRAADGLWSVCLAATGVLATASGADGLSSACLSAAGVRAAGSGAGLAASGGARSRNATATMHTDNTAKHTSHTTGCTRCLLLISCLLVPTPPAGPRSF